MPLAIILASFVALSSSLAQADTWCHDSRSTAEGGEISLHNGLLRYYSRFSGEFIQRANPWVHLSGPSLTGTEKVRFVVVTLLAGSDGIFREAGSTQVDAAWDSLAQRFSAEVKDFTLLISGNYLMGEQQVAVVVDGHWIQRADGGGSNFAFNANNDPGFCANPY